MDESNDPSRTPIRVHRLPLPVYLFYLKVGITRTLEFARKSLADFGVNIGVACGHACRFCSSRAVFRCHEAFRHLGLSPFATDYAVVDPRAAVRVRRDACGKRRRGQVLLCTASNAWAPEAQHFGLGRGCAEAILAEPGWTLRVLTKNAAVCDDFDLFDQHRDRVMVGLSSTFLPTHTEAARAVEPYASPPQQRLEAMIEASRRGLSTFGMLCPLIAPFYQNQADVDEAFKAILPANPQEIFAEPVNARGKGLIHTADALRSAGLKAKAVEVDALRSQERWSAETARLIEMVVDTAERLYEVERLRVLLYPGRLTAEGEQRLRRIAQGIVWLD
jgi:DNA repair photolyase